MSRILDDMQFLRVYTDKFWGQLNSSFTVTEFSVERFRLSCWDEWRLGHEEGAAWLM
jgi:hypothetical protein